MAAAPPQDVTDFVKKLFKDAGKKPSETMADPHFVSTLATALGLEPTEISDVLKKIKDELKDETRKLVPDGFTPTDNNVVNPLLSDGARPKLTLEQANYLNTYTGSSYESINSPLHEGKLPVSPYLELYQEIQAAFKNTKEFPPVTVERGIDFKDSTKLKHFVQQFIDSEGKPTKELVPLKGFISTGTAGAPGDFKKGNISLKIIAKKGLDMGPYTKTPEEKELLLNHNTNFKVHGCEETGDKWFLVLEQMIPEESVPEEPKEQDHL